MARKSLNSGDSKKKPGGGAPANEQDVQRRLGNFTTAGEPARQGGRTTGIVGQTTKKNHTDRKKKS